MIQYCHTGIIFMWLSWSLKSWFLLVRCHRHFSQLPCGHVPFGKPRFERCLGGWWLEGMFPKSTRTRMKKPRTRTMIVTGPEAIAIVGRCDSDVESRGNEWISSLGVVPFISRHSSSASPVCDGFVGTHQKPCQIWISLPCGCVRKMSPPCSRSIVGRSSPWPGTRPWSWSRPWGSSEWHVMRVVLLRTEHGHNLTYATTWLTICWYNMVPSNWYYILQLILYIYCKCVCIERVSLPVFPPGPWGRSRSRSRWVSQWMWSFENLIWKAWIYLPSKSHKWRFSLGFPNLNM